MERLRKHPGATLIVAFALAAAAVVGIAAAYGFGAFTHAWDHLQPAWIVVAIAGEVLALPAYVFGYRGSARVNDGPRLRFPLAARVVAAGFGAHAAGGGFGLDKRAMQAVESDPDAATVRVLGLSALEWALLAPAAWVAAVILLGVGDSRPMPSLLWPWAVAVPIGFAVGLWFSSPKRRPRLDDAKGRPRRALAKALAGAGVLHSLAEDVDEHWHAWVGTALYWAFDIAAFYGSIRFVGLHVNVAEAILAYATGYALTRRSMPLGGAGVTEALMTFALHWVGQPVAPALAAVIVYRVFNFVLPTVPALIARRRILPLVSAPDQDRASVQRARRFAAAPLGHSGK